MQRQPTFELARLSNVSGARRIARPEDVARMDSAWEAIGALPGPPWEAHTSRALCSALQISPLSLADWRFQSRDAPPHEDPRDYPRARGFVYRQDRLLSWLHRLLQRPGVLEPWQLGADFVEKMFGARASDPSELDDLIGELHRLGLITLSITPAHWPDSRPYSPEDGRSRNSKS